MTALVFGVPVEVNFWVVLIFALSLAGVSFVYFWGLQPRMDWKTLVIVSLISVALMMVGIVLHELGHAVVAMYFGGTIKSVVFALTPSVDFYLNRMTQGEIVIVSLAGPVFGLIYSLINAAIGRHTGKSVFVAAGYIALLNFIYSMINLLPFGDFDGASIFDYIHKNLALQLPGSIFLPIYTTIYFALVILAFYVFITFLGKEYVIGKPDVK